MVYKLAADNSFTYTLGVENHLGQLAMLHYKQQEAVGEVSLLLYPITALYTDIAADHTQVP